MPDPIGRDLQAGLDTLYRIQVTSARTPQDKDTHGPCVTLRRITLGRVWLVCSLRVSLAGAMR